MSETNTIPSIPQPGRPLSAAEEALFAQTGEGRESAAVDNANRPAILDHMTPSGLRQKYVVELTGDRFIEVETGLPDVLRWERTYKKGWFDPNGMSLARLVFITWSALKRHGLYEGTPQQFEQELVELHLQDQEEDGEPDPTNEDRGAFS